MTKLGTSVFQGREHVSVLDTFASLLDGAPWIGDGPLSRRCEAMIRQQLGAQHAYLMPSCTSALEMACLLIDIRQGDEVIMPSWGFSSAANAVVLRGAVPVFVDIRPDTLNINEALIAAAVTEHTRAIMVVHYAGVCCEMDDIIEVADRHGLEVIEDAAQAYLSGWRGAPVGMLSDVAAFSFHDTKNVRCGEGGALITSSPGLARRAEIMREKGTNRSAFLRGEVDKYTWVDLGMSGVVSEFQAAVLLDQLMRAEAITRRRRALWDRYHEALADMEGTIQRPNPPAHCWHNGHIYWVLLPTGTERDRVLAALRAEGIKASFHFVPLHSSPAGLHYGRVSGSMAVTDDVAARLLRLPLSHATTEDEVDRAVAGLRRA